MRTFSREEAVARMNGLGAAGEPFVFVIDYEGVRNHVERPADIDGHEWLYQFNGFANPEAGDRGGEEDTPDSAASASGQEYTPESPAPAPDRTFPVSAAPPCAPFRWEIDAPPLAAYVPAFQKVKREIAAGNSYLLNLTSRTPVRTDLALKEMYRRAAAPYKCWLKDRFVCFSPECFVRVEEGRIATYPMKGTIDAAQPDAPGRLLDDAKEQAEHATIVDLLRNDLSRIAAGVTVTRYRYLEKINTHRGALWQTSSEIAGRLPSGWEAHIGDWLYALLPAGSITGAPKKKTMEIIAAAEPSGRGYYTGIMGYFDGRRLDSAVMIRFVEQEGEALFFRSGGGITSQSDLESEYREMIQKIYLPTDCPPDPDSF